jgi:hypothetical protein
MSDIYAAAQSAGDWTLSEIAGEWDDFCDHCRKGTQFRESADGDGFRTRCGTRYPPARDNGTAGQYLGRDYRQKRGTWKPILGRFFKRNSS